MQENKITATYKTYESLAELSNEDQKLINAAVDASKLAYAPYSNFQVGAAILLDNGKVIIGSNQENASFPVGICAERVALSNIAMQFPNHSITTIAIYANNKPHLLPAAPCGMCRQAMYEKEHLQQQPIRILLKGNNDKVFEINSVNDLLPLAFSGSDL